MYEFREIILKKLRRWELKDEPGPSVLELYPTQKCNLSCRMCLQSTLYDKNAPELSDEEFLKIIRGAINAGAGACLISGGGEPFCRRELVLEMMGVVKKSGLKGSLITNATLIREADAVKMVVLGWDYIHVSIDGPNAEINDYLRGTGTFDQACRFLAWLNTYQVTYQQDKPRVIFNFVITRSNCRVPS